MINHFNHGNYLTYALYPAHRVFIDGRTQIFPEDVLRDYMTLRVAAPQWPEVLDKYAANFVIWPTDAPLSKALEKSSLWDHAYGDDVALVFTRVRKDIEKQKTKGVSASPSLRRLKGNF